MKTLGVFGAAVCAALLSGCNDLTGAGDLTIDDGRGGASAASSGVGPTTGPSSTVTTGTSSSGATTGGGGAPAGAGATSSSSAVTTTTTSSSVASSSGSPTGACTYPAGGYGVDMGTIVAPTFSWQGYAEGSAQLSTISIEAYFDCDGTKGVNALLVDVSATWCSACQQEAMDLPGQVASWTGKGIHVLTLMIEDADQNPATTQTALDWRNAFGLTQIAVAADPNFSFQPSSGDVGLPMQVLVDPRTMRIVEVDQGYSGDYSAVEQLAQQNTH
jgi:hypothetical protein